MKKRTFNAIDLHGGGGKLLYTEPCFIKASCFFDITGTIHIGPYCVLSDQVFIYTHEHGHKLGYPQALQPVKHSDLWIGRDVYVGARATVLEGCYCIGEGAVIGAASVVTRDIPPYEIWAGNPARKIKDRVD